jgi:hypothetical protein
MDAVSVYSNGSIPGRLPRRGSILHESDGAVHSLPVDLETCEWVKGSDGLEHMRLPLWMHPQTDGSFTLYMPSAMCCFA